MITLVIASHFKEYVGYLIENKIPKKENIKYKYIRDGNDTRGRTPHTVNPTIIVVNKHRLNNEKYELLEPLANRGFKFEEFNY